MFSALEAKENVSNTNKAIISAICSKVERASRQGRRKIYFETPRQINKDEIAALMRELGYKSWATAKSVAVEW